MHSIRGVIVYIYRVSYCWMENETSPIDHEHWAMEGQDETSENLSFVSVRDSDLEIQVSSCFLLMHSSDV